MRIEVKCCSDKITSIPINYQYYLTSSLYSYIGESDPEFADYIHEEGFGDENRNFKLFTYSYLRGSNMKACYEEIRIEPGCFRWYIASPLEDILKAIVDGMMKTGKLHIRREEFYIDSIKGIINPDFKRAENFICNSPIVATEKRRDGSVHYVDEFDRSFNDAINRNLCEKYEVLYGEKYRGDGIYVASKKKPKHKLVRYKDIKIRGLYDKFSIIGDPVLMNIAYDTGLGMKNSMGFGMIERSKYA